MRTGRISFSAGGQDGSFPDKQFQRRVFFNEEKLPGFVLFAPGHSREPVPAAGTYVGSVRAPLPRTATGKLFLAAREKLPVAQNRELILRTRSHRELGSWQPEGHPPAPSAFPSLPSYRRRWWPAGGRDIRTGQSPESFPGTGFQIGSY